MHTVNLVLKVQDADSAAPWSCAKQLGIHMEAPTPQAYPAGIAPTPKSDSQQPAAMHPQGSWLFPPSDSKAPAVAATSFRHCAETTSAVPFSSQSQKHHRAAQSSSDAATPPQAEAETLSTCKQLEEHAAMLAPHCSRSQLVWQAQARAQPLMQSSIDRLPQSDVELFSACQQLADATADHAQHRATLQQALTELSRQNSPTLDSAESSVAAARIKANQLEQSSGSSALLQAFEASCTEDVQDAEYTDDDRGHEPKELSLACKQLAEAVSAHASQRQQLQQLLQHQLAAPRSKDLHSAVTLHQTVTQPGRQHAAAKIACDKAVACNKPGPRVKQRCSAVNTAAWPPRPPHQQVKGPLLQASLAGRAAKGLTSKAQQFQSSACTDAYQSANLGQLSDKAAVQAKLTAAQEAADVEGGTYMGSPATLLHDTLVHEQDMTRLQIHGLTTVAVSDNAVGTAGVAMEDLEGNVAATSDLGVAASGDCLEAAADQVEPSFGSVHAMLSALQLPRMEAAILWEDTAMAHTCGLLQEGTMSLEDSPASCRSCLCSSSFALCHAEEVFGHIPCRSSQDMCMLLCMTGLW